MALQQACLFIKYLEYNSLSGIIKMVLMELIDDVNNLSLYCIPCLRDIWLKVSISAFVFEGLRKHRLRFSLL